MDSDHKVAKVDELSPGETKEIEVSGAKILLVRQGDEYRALGGTCPHKGAPLAGGSLVGSHLRCPWHQAVFDASDGYLKEPCSLDSVPRFDTRISGDDVYVTLPDEIPEGVTPEMVRPDPAADDRTFVILGTGAGGMAAAEALRTDGFRGRILMITREEDLPYDRTDLSKSYLAEEEETPFVRSAEFYREHGIEVLLGKEVVRVDVGSGKVCFGDGSELDYDKLLLATGSIPRRLGIPGEDLGNVFTLRSLRDCEGIRASAQPGLRAVIMGASFIAMEAASGLAGRGVKVTIVAPDEVPLAKTLGPDIGRMYQGVHEENGVAFRLGRRATRLVGNRKVEEVVLDNGERLEADMVVVGVGVKPVTGYLKGVELNQDGSVSVDSHMMVAPGVYAAGDIARVPDWRTGEPIRIEHWRYALQLGRLAAHNMAGQSTEYDDVPFFWTPQFSVNTKYVGHAHDWDEIVYEGDPVERDFVAYYIKDGRVEAASGCGQALKICQIAEVLRSRKKPTLGELREKLRA